MPLGFGSSAVPLLSFSLPFLPSNSAQPRCDSEPDGSQTLEPALSHTPDVSLLDTLLLFGFFLFSFF